MTISPTILIIAALIIVTLIGVAVREIHELSSENETLRRELAAYIMAFGQAEADLKALTDKIDAADIEINPKTGKPYKTTKAQREASKKWNAKHTERNSTESSKESRRKYASLHAEEHKEKYIKLWYNGRPRTARKEHCHRVIGKQGKEKWEVLPQFRDHYAWCKGVQDETP